MFINSDQIDKVQPHLLTKIFPKLSSIVCFPVEHTHFSYGISLYFESKFKFSYTGDLLPNTLYRSYINNSNICVHECTFGNTMKKQAIDGKHTTIKDIIKLSKSLNIEYLILTHFSPRYITSVKII